ncbi:MAG: dihydropteroate synthase [Pseudomonadota bacterium]
MKIVGIVNVTPDSFSDGGHHPSPAAAIEHGLRLVDQGADVLDIGGESTRPGASPVAFQEECDRVLPVIEGLSARTSVPLSIDTRKPEVARGAIGAGARIWNDVSALSAHGALACAAELGCLIILMHMKGDPATMQASPRYRDVTAEVFTHLKARIDACVQTGVDRGKIIADPGIGFGKTLEHNLTLLRDLHVFRRLNVPLMLGASRKRFIAGVDRDTGAADRVGGSLAAALRGEEAGYDYVRVHDVAETRQALAVARAMNSYP